MIVFIFKIIHNNLDGLSAQLSGVMFGLLSFFATVESTLKLILLILAVISMGLSIIYTYVNIQKSKLSKKKIKNEIRKENRSEKDNKLS